MVWSRRVVMWRSHSTPDPGRRRCLAPHPGGNRWGQPSLLLLSHLPGEMAASRTGRAILLAAKCLQMMAVWPSSAKRRSKRSMGFGFMKRRCASDDPAFRRAPGIPATRPCFVLSLLAGPCARLGAAAVPAGTATTATPTRGAGQSRFPEHPDERQTVDDPTHPRCSAGGSSAGDRPHDQRLASPDLWLVPW